MLPFTFISVLHGSLKKLKYPNGVKKNDQDGDWSDKSNEDLPNGITHFALHVELCLASFLGHEPARKNCNAYSSKRQHEVRS